MIFSSGIFLIFLLLFLVFYGVFTGKRSRLIIIAIFSIFFYATWNYKLIWIVIFPTVIDYFLGHRIEASATRQKKKYWLVTSLIFNLGLLFYFKYSNFFIANINAAAESLSGHNLLPYLNVILPVGISFYTFESISYIVDVYRGDIKSCKSFLQYFGYIVFFPKFVAGPIVRFAEYDKEFQAHVYHRIQTADFAIGLQRFIEGFFKKKFLADQIALVSDKVFANPLTDPATAWIGLLAYTFQIYYDFSGYSDMGIGIARMLGFRLPENFDRPYHAKNIQEFWRKWHMTLSRWLRDYLYISIGGNRKGAKRTRINLLVTMLLGGLWHGASWNFVIWGGIHGTLLLVHRTKWFQRAAGFIAGRVSANFFYVLSVMSTFITVAFAWVFFRARTLPDSINFFRSLFGLVQKPVNTIHPFIERVFEDQKFNIDKQLVYSVIILGIIVLYQSASSFINYRKIHFSSSVIKMTAFYIVLIFVMLVFTLPSKQKAFIYFQF